MIFAQGASRGLTYSSLAQQVGCDVVGWGEVVYLFFGASFARSSPKIHI